MGVYFMDYIWINLDTQQWLIHKLTVYLVRVKIGRWKWVQEKWGENDMKWYLVKGGNERDFNSTKEFSTRVYYLKWFWSLPNLSKKLGREDIR